MIKKEVLLWSTKIIDDVNNLLIKYNVISFEVNKNSYMGIIIDCVTNNRENIFIKVLPPMIEGLKLKFLL